MCGPEADETWIEPYDYAVYAAGWNDRDNDAGTGIRKDPVTETSRMPVSPPRAADAGVAALREKALAATPGPWSYYQYDNIILSADDRRILSIQPKSDDVGLPQRDANGAYVAAANPAVILRLTAALAEQTAENHCDACVGTGKPISGLPCMCGGTGRMSDAARYLREQLAERDTSIESLEGITSAAIADRDMYMERCTERDREVAELRELVTKLTIEEWNGGARYKRCKLCKREWGGPRPEKHAPGCLAALRAKAPNE